jgi:hypothetical protein
MKKIIKIIAVCFLAFQLSACQLALPEGDVKKPDQLCGMFITFEPLNKDADGDFDFQVNSLGELEQKLNDPKEQICYAKLQKQKDGMADYVFEGIDGVRFIDSLLTENGEKFHSFISDECIESLCYTQKDEFEIEISATLPVDVRNTSVIYPNPVYLKADGRVYTIQGTGVSYENAPAGRSGSASVSQTITETANGKPQKRMFTAQINFDIINTPVKSVLKQMNNNDSVINEMQITKEYPPKSIRLRQDTAYMILEEYGLDIEGKTVVERSLIKRDEKELKCRFSGINGEIKSYSIPLEK